MWTCTAFKSAWSSQTANTDRAAYESLEGLSWSPLQYSPLHYGYEKHCELYFREHILVCCSWHLHVFWFIHLIYVVAFNVFILIMRFPQTKLTFNLPFVNMSDEELINFKYTAKKSSQAIVTGKPKEAEEAQWTALQ